MKKAYIARTLFTFLIIINTSPICGKSPDCDLPNSGSKVSFPKRLDLIREKLLRRIFQPTKISKARAQDFKRRLDNLDWELSDISASKGTTEDRILDAFKDKESFTEWAHELREEVVHLMIQDGLKRKVNNPEFFEEYLDKVIVRRAKRLGYKVDSDKPYILESLDEDEFFATLKDKRFFYENDNLAENAVGIVEKDGIVISKKRHYRRGHGLQILYLTDTVPGFLDYYSDLGKNKLGKDWLLLFDNMFSEGLNWPGNVVETLSPLLHIKD